MGERVETQRAQAQPVRAATAAAVALHQAALWQGGGRAKTEEPRTTQSSQTEQEVDVPLDAKQPTADELANTDTTNDLMVGARGDDILILRLGRVLDREAALRLAAWIVAIADPGGDDFERIYAAICAT